MAQPFQISIPKPCTENWANMTPNEQGRFCQSCQKTVVDFTQMTDTELMRWFEKQAGQNTCGRLSVAQINRKILSPIPLSKTPTWARYAAVVAGLWAATSAKGQTEKTVLGDTTYVSVPNPSTTVATNDSTQTICGLVIDADGQPIKSASIILEGTDLKTQTDDLGFYQFKLDAKTQTQVINLSVNTTGFITQTIRPILQPNQMFRHVFTMKKAAFVIKGSIFDSTSNEALVGASIVLKGTNLGVIADLDGNFEIALDAEAAAKTHKLECSSLGYSSREIHLDYNQPVLNLSRILMDGHFNVLGGAVMVYHPSLIGKIQYKTRVLKRRIRRLFDR